MIRSAKKSMFEKGNLKNHTTIFLPDPSDLVKVFFVAKPNTDRRKKHGYLRHGAMYYSIGSILFKSGRPTKSAIHYYFLSQFHAT
jgi:hypothetical protein